VRTFRVGEFSRLARVSVKTLHYYDEIGLLSPALVDADTGYRYYNADQLPRVNRLLALKQLGFTLTEIATLLDGAVTAQQLRGMLLLRRSELQQQRARTDARLAEVEVRLRQIEQEHSMTTPDILTKPVPAQLIAGARAVVGEVEHMRERCIELDAAACSVITTAGLATDGTSFALYYPSDTGVDVEMAYAVTAVGEDRPLPAQVHELPAAQVAYAVYRGSYDDFGAVGRTHVALADWLAAQQLRLTGPVREIYLQPPTGGSRDGLMELQYPIG
jgi:DNA-binding transcriptional MerR regulator